MHGDIFPSELKVCLKKKPSASPRKTRANRCCERADITIVYLLAYFCDSADGTIGVKVSRSIATNPFDFFVPFSAGLRCRKDGVNDAATGGCLTLGSRGSRLSPLSNRQAGFMLSLNFITSRLRTVSPSRTDGFMADGRIVPVTTSHIRWRRKSNQFASSQVIVFTGAQHGSSIGGHTRSVMFSMELVVRHSWSGVTANTASRRNHFVAVDFTPIRR